MQEKKEEKASTPFPLSPGAMSKKALGLSYEIIDLNFYFVIWQEKKVPPFEGTHVTIDYL